MKKSIAALAGAVCAAALLIPATVQHIASEALGRKLKVLSPGDIGLILPDSGLRFDDLAAPAGLAALGA